MNVRLIGDIHCDGCFKNRFTKNTICVGDLCLIGYRKWNFEKNIGRRYFIDGNHEAFPLLNPDADEPYTLSGNLVYIPRGFRSNETLFIGGAGSIDKSHRVPGRDWFSEEEISQKQINKIFEEHGNRVIDAVVSHDIPYEILGMIVPQVWDQFASSNKALQVIFDYFKPKIWVFGHHHKPIDIEYKGCKFIGLDIGEVRNVDLPIAEDFFEKNF